MCWHSPWCRWFARLAFAVCEGCASAGACFGEDELLESLSLSLLLLLLLLLLARLLAIAQSPTSKATATASTASSKRKGKGRDASTPSNKATAIASTPSTKGTGKSRGNNCKGQGTSAMLPAPKPKTVPLQRQQPHRQQLQSQQHLTMQRTRQITRPASTKRSRDENEEEIAEVLRDRSRAGSSLNCLIPSHRLSKKNSEA